MFCSVSVCKALLCLRVSLPLRDRQRVARTTHKERGARSSFPPVRRLFVAASAFSSVPVLFFLPGNTGRGNTGKGCRWFIPCVFLNSTPLKVASPPLGVPLPPSFSLFVRCSSRCFISLLRDVFGVDRGQRLPRCPWFPCGSPVVRRAGSPVFVPCSKSARENLCSDGGKVEGFRPRVYAPLFSSVRLLFAVRLLCGFCAALFSGFGPDRVRARYFHNTAAGCQAPGSPGGMPPAFPLFVRCSMRFFSLFPCALIFVCAALQGLLVVSGKE